MARMVGRLHREKGIETFGLTIKEFEANYRMDVTGPTRRFSGRYRPQARSSCKPNWAKNTAALLTTESLYERSLIVPFYWQESMAIGK